MAHCCQTIADFNKNKISVPPSMKIKSLKQFILNKLNIEDLTIDEISIYYNGIVMDDEYSFDNVDKVYKLPTDKKINTFQPKTETSSNKT